MESLVLSRQVPASRSSSQELCPNSVHRRVYTDEPGKRRFTLLSTKNFVLGTLFELM